MKLLSTTATTRCYPYALLILFLAQKCMLIGMIFSTAAVVDCDFITANLDLDVMPIPLSLDGLVQGDNRRRGLGFLTHEDNDGSCRWKNQASSSNPESEIVEEYTEVYMDWQGSDWEKPRHTSIATLGLSFLLFLWLMVLCCLPHPAWLRYSLAGMIGVFLTILQYVAFGILGSDFCEGRNCELGRSGSYAMTAGIMFVLAGILCCFIQDKPSEETSSSQDVPGKRQHDAAWLPSTETIVEEDELEMEEGLGQTEE